MGRSPVSDKNGLKKGPWTSEEDQKLVNYIQKHGYGNWRTLPGNAGLQRCGKSCRLRWTNYLRPDIKRGKFSYDEEDTIIQLHSILGNKWSCIASRLPGRTDNEIKNYWNTHIRKKLLRMGIDPVTHNPRLDLLDLSSIISSSLFNTSQTNLPFVHPEILKLATSLLSSSPSQKVENQNAVFCQNDQENHLFNIQYQSQFEQPLPQSTSHIDVSNWTNFANEEPQLLEQLINSSSQNSQLNEWQLNNGVSSSFLNDDYVNRVLNYDNCNGSYQPIMDNQFDNSVLHSSHDNRDFSFASMFSTPSSSPTPLHSNNSTYPNGSGTEDERESYCSNMFNFEVQNDMFGHVNGFTM